MRQKLPSSLVCTYSVRMSVSHSSFRKFAPAWKANCVKQSFRIVDHRNLPKRCTATKFEFKDYATFSLQYCSDIFILIELFRLTFQQFALTDFPREVHLVNWPLVKRQAVAASITEAKDSLIIWLV